MTETATKTLYAVRPVAYRPRGWDNPMTPVSFRPGAEYQPGDALDDRVPDWIVEAWLQAGRVSTERPTDLPKRVAHTHLPEDVNNVLGRSVIELQAGTQDRLKAVIAAVGRVEQVSADEARLRVIAAIRVVGDVTLEEALANSGMDVAAIGTALPDVRAERAADDTERERQQWQAAVREAA
jgi:ribosomal protein L12E/L44/L45/RPP1/RPP2